MLCMTHERYIKEDVSIHRGSNHRGFWTTFSFSYLLEISMATISADRNNRNDFHKIEFCSQRVLSWPQALKLNFFLRSNVAPGSKNFRSKLV